MIEPLLRWYDAHCDGEWEHRYGFRIETADNPGLIVTLDVAEDPGLEPETDRLIFSLGEQMELRVRGGQMLGFAAPGREVELFSEIGVLLARAAAG